MSTIEPVRRRITVYPTTKLSKKHPDEKFHVYFDVSKILDVGETVSSISVAASVDSGTDESPSSILSGSAEETSTTGEIRQLIQGGLDGVTYKLSCTVVTSARTLPDIDLLLPVSNNP